jgi:hypothetical protein
LSCPKIKEACYFFARQELTRKHRRKIEQEALYGKYGF